MFWLILLGYNLLFPLAWLIMLPGAISRTRKRGGSWEGIYERFGFYEPEVREKLKRFRGSRLIWVHAVSVGEAQVAVKLSKALLNRDSEIRIALTTSTPTGQEVAKVGLEAETARVAILFAPFDFPLCVISAFRLIRPTDLVLMESEIWPNWLAMASLSRVPVTLANARLSPRSASRYRALRWLAKPVLQKIRRIQVADETDASRWEKAGFPGNLLEVTGNLKFDMGDAADLRRKTDEFAQAWTNIGGAERPVLLGASTHPGEEMLLLKTAEILWESIPGLILFLTPRHAERGDDLALQLADRGVAPVRRSQVAEGRILPREKACFLLDVTGELAVWQHFASVVVIGKSFLAEGGQNPGEAPLAGKPVIFGPNMRNFQALADGLVDCGAALRVEADPAKLAEAVGNLLRDPEKSAGMAEKGRSLLLPHRGAADRAAEKILKS